MQDIWKLKISVAVKRYITIKRIDKDKGRSTCRYIDKSNGRCDSCTNDKSKGKGRSRRIVITVEIMYMKHISYGGVQF